MKKILILLALILAVCFGSQADTKKLNHGFLKKAAKMVWGQDMPQFNPNAELTDTIFDNVSAANIAVYYYFSADRHEMNTLRDGRVPPKEWRLGETEAIFMRRYMTRILDEKALEDLSLFSFEPSLVEKIQQMLVMEENNAFGARIYKPDGRMIEVDMKQTLTDGDGKKGKDAVKHKIAIPGLEVGDVLDYFFYTESYFLGNSGCRYVWRIMSDYPSKSFLVEAKLDPSLTSVVSAYNGIKAPYRYNDRDGDVCMKWDSDDLPALKDPTFCQEARQLPIMRIEIADNISEIYTHPKSRRSPGVFFNPPVRSTLPSVAEHFATRKWEGGDMSKAASIMKDYRIAHPDATDSEIADATFMATRYVTHASKDPYTVWDMTSFMKDLLDKQEIDSVSFLGVTNPRSDIDVNYITSYSHGTPMLTVAGKHYIFTPNLALAPGEIPSGYCGEPFFKMGGKRKDLYNNFFYTEDRLPRETAAANSAVFDVNVSIEDPDETSVKLSYDATRKGYFKSIAGSIAENSDMVEEYEKKLGIPQKIYLNMNRGTIHLGNRFDKGKIEEEQKKKLEEIYRNDLGIESMDVDSLVIDNFGFNVESPEFRYHLAGTVEDVLAPAGDDIILNIGKLAQVVQISEKERNEKNREVSIFTPAPYIRRVNVTVTVPEGYSVDKDALQSLAKQSSGRTGVFMSQVNYNEENSQINLTVLLRNPAMIYNPDQWEAFRKIREDAASFNEAGIVFHRE